MLSIQPKFNINQQSFGKSEVVPVVIVPQTGALSTLYNDPEGPRNRKYTPYEEIPADEESPKRDGYDVGSKAEFQQTVEEAKASIQDLANTAGNIPVVKKSTNILSSLLAIVIGWGGLRWGAAGTIEILSRMSKMKPAQAVGGFLKNTAHKAAGLFTKFKSGKMYTSIAGKLASVKNTKIGTKVSDTVNTVKGTKAFDKVSGALVKFKDWVKKINPKQVFIETMGVAGGVTAGINTLGGKAVDGTRQTVEKTSGGYVVDGKGVYSNAA